MNTILIAIFLFVVAIVIVWTIVVRKNNPDKMSDWLNTLIATFLSAVTAVMVGLLVYNWQVNDADQRQRQDLTLLLQLEFSSTRQILSGEPMNLHIGETPTKALITHIKPIGIEKAAQSGLFNATDTFNLLRIAHKIRLYDLEVEFLLEFLNTEPASQDSLSRSITMAQNVNSEQQSIITDIEMLAKQLHINLIEIK